MGQSLEQFVHEANVERYEALLKSCRDNTRRRQLQKLLSEESATGDWAAPAGPGGLKSRGAERQ